MAKTETAGNPLSFAFWAGADPSEPTSQEALAMRRKIAESLMGKRSPYPKNIGEGIASLGESIGDVMSLKALQAAERQYGVALRKQAGEAGVPGTRVAPAAAVAPPLVMRTGATPPVDPRDAVTAAAVGPPPDPDAPASFTDRFGAVRDDPRFTEASDQPAPTPDPVSPAVLAAASTGKVPLPPPRPVFDRSRLNAEIQADPSLLPRMQTIVQGEVGRTRSPQQQLQIEEMFNRAVARDQPLRDVLQEYAGKGYMKYGPRGFTGEAGPTGYYPGDTFKRGQARQAEVDPFYSEVTAPAMRGESISDKLVGFPATGNASGGVARRGIATGRYGPYASLGGDISRGGELYVQQPSSVERPERLEATRLPPRNAVAQLGNPPIVRSDITTLPRGVPEPMTPPGTPTPPEQIPRVRTAPFQDYPEPVAPVKRMEPTPEEIRAWKAIMANPTDTNVRAIWEPHIKAARDREDARYAREVDEYKAKVEVWKKDQERKQLYGQDAAKREGEQRKLEYELQERAQKLRQEKQYGLLGKEGTLKAIEQSHAKVETLPTAMDAIAKAKSLISDKSFTGLLGEAELTAAKAKTALGSPPDPRIANTETYKAVVAQIFGGLRSSIVGPGDQSGRELDTLRQAAAGDIRYDKKSIIDTLDNLATLSINKARDHQRRLATASGEDPDEQRNVYGQFGLPLARILPDEYVAVFREEFAKNPEAAAKRLDDKFHTPGLARSLIESGRL